MKGAPDVRNATLVEELTWTLEHEGCPLTVRLRLTPKRSAEYNLWQLPIVLPAPKGRQPANLPIDIAPLKALYATHSGADTGPLTWVYRLHYFELLHREGRLSPAFWIAPGDWPVVRSTCRKLLGDMPAHYRQPQSATSRATRTRRGGEKRSVRPTRSHGQKAWQQKWQRLMNEGVVQTETPANWLDMLAWDEEAWATDGVFEEAVVFHKLPAYMGVKLDDVRNLMLEDLGDALLYVPSDGNDALRRWRSTAERLGLTYRWPTRGEQLLERRRALVVSLIKEGLPAKNIADELIARGLYPVHPKGHDPGYSGQQQRRNATSTVHRIIKELVADGDINEDDITRRPPGRPQDVRKE